MDVDAIRGAQSPDLGLGDYAALSEALRPAAEALADACAVSAGQEVLDVAAGDGNFALVCAREGASVVASDLSPGMVERGRARAQGRATTWSGWRPTPRRSRFDDASFDCVGSVFGAIIATPAGRGRGAVPRRAPRGTVGMTAWTRRATPPSCSGSAAATPRRPTSRSRTSGRTRRPCASGSTASRRGSRPSRASVWEADSPEALVAMLGTSAPPWVAAKQNLPPERWDSLVAEALEVAQRWAGDERPVRLANEYALIVARKRG